MCVGVHTWRAGDAGCAADAPPADKKMHNGRINLRRRKAGVLPMPAGRWLPLFMQLRIYLVEDNPIILKWLAEALEELTDTKVIGSSGTEGEACRWLNAHRFSWDVAVVDLWLAQGNGLQVIKHLNPTDSQKIVVLTNYPTPQMRELCMSAGADAFFDKSTELDEFTTYVFEEGAHHQDPPEGESFSRLAN
ncbi:response regulator [Polaromonas sp. DSR2-3-2]|uniref:response regulator n=2 Tax=unclassified Polaromonas TaxID=2638319 RepID=UPI003CE7A2F4